MSVLLIGHWDHGTLTITESYSLADGDQAAIDELLDRPDADTLWAYEFLVDRHEEAVQRAYDQEVIPEAGESLLDEAMGYEPMYE
jgi:hypothetical protein